jgi:hypothetical protein
MSSFGETHGVDEKPEHEFFEGTSMSSLKPPHEFFQGNTKSISKNISKGKALTPVGSPVVGSKSPTGVQAHLPASASATPAIKPKRTEPSAAALQLAERFYRGTGMKPPSAEAWKLERLHERAQAGAEYTEADISLVAEHFLTDPFYAAKMTVGMFVKSFPRWLFEFRKKGVAAKVQPKVAAPKASGLYDPKFDMGKSK